MAPEREFPVSGAAVFWRRLKALRVRLTKDFMQKLFGICSLSRESPDGWDG